MIYRRKPELVEAFQFSADSEITAPKWFADAVDQEQIYIDKNLVDGAIHTYGCSIRSGKVWLKGKVGDYIIKDSLGKIYPCNKRDFSRQYEREEVPAMPVKKHSKASRKT